MPRVTDTRERMLKATARLLRRQGYHATSWRQMVAESDTPWGSQAHHFPGGKEQLAAEAIALAGARYERLLRSALADADPADAIERWGRVAARELEASGWADGCPIATVALETAHTSDTLAGACDAVFTGWLSVLQDAIESRGTPPERAAPLAVLVLAGIEGALVLARAARSGEPLRIAGRELGALVRDRTG